MSVGRHGWEPIDLSTIDQTWLGLFEKPFLSLVLNIEGKIRERVLPSYFFFLTAASLPESN